MHWYNARLVNSYIEKVLQECFEAYTQRDDCTSNKSIVDRSIWTYFNDLSDTFSTASKADSRNAAVKELITGQIKLFIFSGHDSTSASVCWSFYLLSKSPENLDRIRAEHDAVFGVSLDRAPTMMAENRQILNQLPFTLAVIKETLRLFPVVSGTRFGEPGFSVIAEDGRAYPTEDCLLWSSLTLIHRSPDFWSRPDDFIPDRWLVQPGHEFYPTKGAWRAFEFGPRHCIGQELALLEMKVVLVLSIRRFQFRMPYDEWDQLHPRKGPRHVAGERAYQAVQGGPSEGMPCRVELRDV